MFGFLVRYGPLGSAWRLVGVSWLDKHAGSINLSIYICPAPTSSHTGHHDLHNLGLSCTATTLSPPLNPPSAPSRKDLHQFTNMTRTGTHAADVPVDLLRQLYLSSGCDPALRTVSVDRDTYERRTRLGISTPSSTPPSKLSPSAPCKKLPSRPIRPALQPVDTPLPSGLPQPSPPPGGGSANPNGSSSHIPGQPRSPSCLRSPSVRSEPLVMQSRRSSHQRGIAAGATGRSVLSSTAQHRPQWGSHPMVSTTSGSRSSSITTRDTLISPASAASERVPDQMRLVTYSPALRAPYLPTRALNLVDQKRILVTGG